MQRKIWVLKEWRGQKSLLFLYEMIDQKIVKKLVKEALEENLDLFLIDLKFSADNKIMLVVDGLKGVTVKECMRMSRHIEHNLDRDLEDFSLEVSSPGATEPLVDKRQYIKNLGRILEVQTADEKLEGTLTEANNEQVVLEWKVREPKPIGKGKITVTKTRILPYDSIKQAKVKIKF